MEYLASLLSIFKVTTAGKEQIYLSIAQPLPSPSAYARKPSSGAGAGAGAGAAPGTKPPSPIVGGGVRAAFSSREESKGVIAGDDGDAGPRRSPLTAGAGTQDDADASVPLLGSSHKADDLSVEDFDDDGGAAGTYAPPASSGYAHAV